MTIRAKRPATERPPSPSVAPAELEPGQQPFTTTVRITRADWHALRAAAEEKALQEGGKADSSAILRDILAAWRQSRAAVATTRRSTRRKSP